MEKLIILSIFLVASTLISSILASPPYLFDERIVGGVQVRPNELPYQVSLQRNGLHFCGGVIINVNFILTAAHCVPSPNIASLTVVAGEHSLVANEGKEQTRSVSSRTSHPLYNDDTMENDIAVLELDAPLVFNTAVANIKLPAASDDGTGFGVVSGWGATASGGGSVAVLRKVSVPLMSDAKCQEYYGSNSPLPATIYPSMLCAGFEEGGKDSCQGDSGGPLAVGFDDERYLAGIVSWGYGCALPDFPGVYTAVFNFLDFIQQNTANRKTRASGSSRMKPSNISGMSILFLILFCLLR